MQRSRWLAGIALIALLAGAPAALQMPFGVSSAQAQEASVSFSVFFGELKPHGVWVRHAKYRHVWCPRVDARWRPYTNGRWLYVRDRGWYFDSDEPFAWAVYHYGRWHEDEDLGWCWVPGRHWAPAWVSWRRSNDYIGWAPLRPEEDGYALRLEVNIGEPPEDDWVFVPVRSFTEPQLTVNIVFGDEDPEVYRRTEYVGPVIIQNNVVINNIIDIDFIQQQTNTEVTVVEVASTTDPAATAGGEASGTIEVYAPVIEEPVADEAPPDAVEPEAAEAELAKPADAEAAGDAAVEATTPPVDAEAGASTDATAEEPAEADAETEAAGDAAAPVTECPEGQQLVDGKCVPVPAGDAPSTDAAAPVADTEAPDADAEAPTTEAEVDTEADVGADAEAAPATDDAKPEDEAVEAAPTDDLAPDELECEEGFVPIEGKCIPIADAPADAAPAQ